MAEARFPLRALARAAAGSAPLPQLFLKQVEASTQMPHHSSRLGSACTLGRDVGTTGAIFLGARPAVVPKRVGYSGGDVKNATHRDRVTHAEAMEVTFDEEDEFHRPAGVIRRARSRP